MTLEKSRKAAGGSFTDLKNAQNTQILGSGGTSRRPVICHLGKCYSKVTLGSGNLGHSWPKIKLAGQNLCLRIIIHTCGKDLCQDPCLSFARERKQEIARVVMEFHSDCVLPACFTAPRCTG